MSKINGTVETDEQYKERMFKIYKEKADKWDLLEEEIQGNYINPNTGESWTEEECEQKGFDLLSIGEMVAAAFGWI